MTSRSFAAVIKELEGDLCRAVRRAPWLPRLRAQVAIFYLVLRGLDTIEDDMTLDHDLKVAELRGFYKRLEQPGWNFTQSACSPAGSTLISRRTRREGPSAAGRVQPRHRRVQAPHRGVRSPSLAHADAADTRRRSATSAGRWAAAWRTTRRCTRSRTATSPSTRWPRSTCASAPWHRS